jgi:antagonist of KipI
VIEILEGGFFSTVQDNGRYGYRKYGVPICGAMDSYALRVGNILVGNFDGAAAIEVTLGGLKLRCTKDALIAITGGDLTPRTNNESTPMWTPLWMRKGDVLAFIRLRSGFRTYIAVKGGIGARFVMNSYSPLLRSKDAALSSGDKLAIGEKSAIRMVKLQPLPDQYVPDCESRKEVRVVLGPQDDYFTSEALEVFLNSDYTVKPESDRQGYRLEGPVLKHTINADIDSEACWPGAIQVPGDGLPIILLADAMTTGGYSKIASIISADLDKMGQSKPADKISFKKVSLGEARSLLLVKEERIKEIRRIFWGITNV